MFENTESTQRQYALRDRAVALGWPLEKVIVIDSDLGQSGASAADREGFQRLVTEVGLGRAGIVLGLEVSRLARNCADWHRLLEICALTETLILDEDGLYDPGFFNDRLLLGLKGTFSEAELHVLRAHLRGGILNKARRGELKAPLPIGFVYDAQDRVILDPDQQVQQAIHTLEADWNNRLRVLAEAEEDYQRQCQADRTALDQKSKVQILALAADFPRLWRDPKTPDRERKRMVRLLIEDVALTKAEGIIARVRFKGGTTHTLSLPLPLPAWITWQTCPEIVALIDRLLDEHTDGQIAQLLNEQGRHSGTGQPFTRLLIGRIRRGYQLKDRYHRLRDAGLLSREEIAKHLGISTSTVRDCRRGGLLKAHAYNDKNQYLYERMDQNKPRKAQGIKLADPRRFGKVASHATKEVQDEA